MTFQWSFGGFSFAVLAFKVIERLQPRAVLVLANNKAARLDELVLL